MGKRTKLGAAVGGLFLLALVILWAQREPIAQELINQTLAERGVRGEYDIRSIGTRRQRLENVVIGNPDNPDLIAQWVEIDVGPSFSGPVVRAVRAGGVRLRGRWQDGRLGFGDVDRLLPKPTDEPFALPDIDTALSDVRLGLVTPWGNVGMAFAGTGNLARSFSGQMAVALPDFRYGGVAAGRTAGQFRIETRNRRVSINGPVQMAAISAPGFKLARVEARLQGSSNESATRAVLDWGASARPVQLPFGSAQIIRINGSARYGPAQSAWASGKVMVEGLRPSEGEARQFVSAIPTASGSPAQPLFDALRRAIAGLQQGSTATTRFAFETSPAATRFTAGPGALTSRSGVELTGTGPGFSVVNGNSKPQFQARYTIAGGGFPTGTLAVGLRDAVWQGQAAFDPYTAGSARLSLSPARFRYDRAGLRLSTLVTLDGPLGTGRLTGLQIPLALQPGRSPLSGCVPMSFRSLDIAGLHLSPARLITCLSSKSAQIASPRFSGRVGRSPITLSANKAWIGLSKGDFGLDNLAVRLGKPEQLTQFDVSAMAGTIQSGGANGHLSGASGRLGNVPLLVSGGTGTWGLQKGIFTVKGALNVADLASEPRFLSLSASDFSLRFANDRIGATAILREPKTQTAISNVTISHDLGTGTGNAVLDVPGIRFGNSFQPEALTTVTLGVVANVEGTLAGRGQINWNPDGVNSSGLFRTTAMNLAAAFGPVTGLSGEIRFSDLLGLETAPGQSVALGSVNPGIAVLDGEIRYQLLPGLKARIEGGRWPLAGGSLILEPSTLDLSAAAERRLTFRVEGMDAARFIAQFEFENIAATGIFDGVLPMVFDRNGGRIEGGRLVARGGGTLAYVGEVSNENLGTMGSFAFDALKAIKYQRLAIDLAGPLDGDIVTRISFAGVNQAPINGPRTKLPIKIIGLTNIPFIFNVTITAPFRQLFDMTRTFSDPSLLIERMEPRLRRLQRVPKDEPKPPKAVQPEESDPVQ